MLGHAKHAVDLQEGGQGPADVQGRSWQNHGLALHALYTKEAVENWQELVQNFAEQVGKPRRKRLMPRCFGIPEACVPCKVGKGSHSSMRPGHRNCQVHVWAKPLGPLSSSKVRPEAC